MTDDPSERTTQPNGMRPPDTIESLKGELAAMVADRNQWRERFMILRSRLHGIADSLRRVESEIGRIIDEK